jgi:hypothetical protein
LSKPLSSRDFACGCIPGSVTGFVLLGGGAIVGSDKFKGLSDQGFTPNPLAEFSGGALYAILGDENIPFRCVDCKVDDGFCPFEAVYGEGCSDGKKLVDVGGGGDCEVGCMGVIKLIGVFGPGLVNPCAG